MINHPREHFPAIARQVKGKSLVFLDGPGGTQVPQSVIDAISSYYKTSNANTHGFFITTRETDRVIAGARAKSATLLGAEGGHTISFGHNMTSLNYALSHAIGRVLRPGDEVLITQLDHEANRGPWLRMREQDIKVREVKLKMDGTLDYEDFEEKLNERTRLVAMGWTSNLLGTANQLEWVREKSYQLGAWLLIDAVHAAPHIPIDVQALGCDFLLCSAYKFYGPHIGILYSKPGLLDRLQPDRLRTQYQHAPYCLETGTLNHAALAGVSAAIDFIEDLAPSEKTPLSDDRSRIIEAMEFIYQEEHTIAKKLYDGLQAIEGVSVVGLDFEQDLRAPTVSFTAEGLHPEDICRELGEYGICAWDGHFYAIRAVEVLGLLEKGGVTRMGISIYNTMEEIEYTLEVLNKIVSNKSLEH